MTNVNTIKDKFDTLSENILACFARVKFITFDFDGVWTDNAVYHSADGTETVRRSRADSMGLDMLRDAGLYKNDGMGEISLLILSRETNPVVASVAKKVGVSCIQGDYTKIDALKKEIHKRGISLNEVMIVGNDVNDISCMEHVVKGGGLSVAVADAYPQVLPHANYVTFALGGKGAVREICELLLYARKVHPYL